MKKKKKILFVATVTNHINSFHIPYLKYFKDKGYEVHVATGDDIEVLNYCDRKIIVPINRSPYKISNLKAIKELKSIIKNEEYEIIHCHTPMGGMVARLAAIGARKKGITKVIYTAHGFHFYKGAPLKNWIIYYSIEKFMSRYTDCLITITNEDYNIAIKKFKKTGKIVHVNGVGMNNARLNSEIVEEKVENIKKDFKIKKNDIVLSYIAELNSNKNQTMLINVVNEIKKENKNIKLLLIGDGVSREFYSNLIKELNLEDNVYLLGRRKDILELLSITDIYVASSIREGLPINVIEAMYMGLPIVAKNNRGHRELIRNGIDGFIVENEKEMKDSLNNIINNKKLKEKMSNEVKNKCQKYLIDNVIKDMEQIYEDI